MEWYWQLIIVLATFAFIAIVSKIAVEWKDRHYEVPLGHPYVPEAITNFPDVESGDLNFDVKKRNFVYDENFPYRYKNSVRLRLGHAFATSFLTVFGPLCVRSYFGAIYKNRRVFKKHKDLLKNGYITIANHTMKLDLVIMMISRIPHFPEFPMWVGGAEKRNGDLYRIGGGIPVPHSVKGLKYCFQAMRSVIEDGKWLHVFAEQARWPYYVPIREFKDGAFILAYQTGVPIFPAAFSFRKRHGLYKIFHSKIPLVTLSYGEPVIPDKSLPLHDAVKKMKDETFLEMLRLAGIKDAEQNKELKGRYKYYHYVEGESHLV